MMRIKLFITVLFIVIGLQSFSPGEINEISATDFYLMINQRDDCAILDASPIKYFNKSRIQGAQSIATSEMIDPALKNVDKESPIMVYCKYGERSKEASNKIAKRGYTNVYELKDGLASWLDKGYPLDKTKRGKKGRSKITN